MDPDILTYFFLTSSFGPLSLNRKKGKPALSKMKGKLALSKMKGKPALREIKGKQALIEKKEKASPSKRISTGGICAKRRYTSYPVEIRPPKWKKKVWIGRLKSPEDSKQAADMVFHYTGKKPFHNKDVVRKYPSITCMGRVPGIPEKLSTPEECAEYALAIAKEDKFDRQRKDLINQVKGVLRRPEFGFLSPDPVVVSPERDDVDEEGMPPMEVDENTAMALGMSLNKVPGSAPPQAFVASFDFQGNELASHPRNVGRDFDLFVQYSTSQFNKSMPRTERLDDCPTFQDESK